MATAIPGCSLSLDKTNSYCSVVRGRVARNEVPNQQGLTGNEKKKKKRKNINR